MGLWTSAARRSCGPSGGRPWPPGGSEDPWFSVPTFRWVWLFVLHYGVFIPYFVNIVMTLPDMAETALSPRCILGRLLLAANLYLTVFRCFLRNVEKIGKSKLRHGALD